ITIHNNNQMEDTYYDENYSDSDSESATEIENFPILNFDINVYQDVRNKILQQNSDNKNEDYDLNNATEENISSEFDEDIEEILLDQSPLAQLKGTWEVDRNTIMQWNEKLDELECFEANGSYLHQRLGPGVSNFGCNSKHDDLSTILEKFRNWIKLMAKSDNKLQKQQLIWSLLLAIKILKSGLPKDLIYSPFDNQILPTLLMTQIAFKLAKIDLSDKAKAEFLEEKECTQFGNLLGESLWQSRIVLKNNLLTLKNPQSLEQYATALL
ncbi:334_t:CDS:2, partial [Scutellospora calospora]